MKTDETLATIVDRLAALSQPHRLAVFRLLVVAGPQGRAAGDIADAVGLPASTLSFHLAHLRVARDVLAPRGRRDVLVPLPQAQLRAALELRYDDEGGSVLHAELAELDPKVAARVHVNDRTRIVRALEVAQRGESIAPDGLSHWDAPQRHSTVLVHLQVERAVIRERIDRRTDAMFGAGVLDEIAALAGHRGEHADLVFSSTARKLHGLEDCLGVLRGDWSRTRAIELMATRTRQYAKRQDTWARRWPGMQFIDATDGDVDRIATMVLALRSS